MNKLSTDKKVKIISALVEGNSIRATCRITGAAKGTVIRLLESVGKACSKYQEGTSLVSASIAVNVHTSP